MNMMALQLRLRDVGAYAGKIDGDCGTLTKAAIVTALAAGPDYPAGPTDWRDTAQVLGVTPAHVRTIWEVEASGAAFVKGLPQILFEPHRFSRATGGRFDKSHPHISYSRWGARPYPSGTAGRYGQLVDAVALDVDAGFASASYGGPQILGENYAAAGYLSPWAMARAFSQTEGDQLHGFARFVMANPRMHQALAVEEWATFARLYNGTAYAKNHYDTRLAAAFAKWKAAA